MGTKGEKRRTKARGHKDAAPGTGWPGTHDRAVQRPYGERTTVAVAAFWPAAVVMVT